MGETMSRGPNWTRNEEVLLMSLRAEGVSHRECAERMGRSVAGVMTKVTRLRAREGTLGTSQNQGPYNPWTDEDVERLCDMRERGRSIVDISGALGRSRSSVESKCKYLIAKGTIPSMPLIRGKWEPHEIHELVTLYKRGVRLAHIATAMGRSRRSITTKVERMQAAGELHLRRFPDRRWERKGESLEDWKLKAQRQEARDRQWVDEAEAMLRANTEAALC